jgi:hypothetical protein
MPETNETKRNPQSHLFINQVLRVAAAWVVIAGAPTIDGSLVFRKLRSAKTKEVWLFHLPIIRAVELSDGTSTRGLVLRRKIDGRWHYRRATPEEEANYVSCEIW